MICGFSVFAFSLQQERQIEHCINVVGRNQQGLAQAFDGGFGASLVIQQVGEIVPSFPKCRIGAGRSPQSRFGFDRAGSRPKHDTRSLAVAPQVRQLGDVGGDAPRLVFVAVAGGSLLKRKK